MALSSKKFTKLKNEFEKALRLRGMGDFGKFYENRDVPDYMGIMAEMDKIIDLGRTMRARIERGVALKSARKTVKR
jgi:hypothetical protein